MSRTDLTINTLIATLLSVAIVTFIFASKNANPDLYIRDFIAFFIPSGIATIISSQILYSFIYQRWVNGASILIPAAALVMLAHVLMSTFSISYFYMVKFFNYGALSIHAPHDGWFFGWLGYILGTVLLGGLITFPLGIYSVYLCCPNKALKAQPSAAGTPQSGAP